MSSDAVEMQPQGGAKGDVAIDMRGRGRENSLEIPNAGERDSNAKVSPLPAGKLVPASNSQESVLTTESSHLDLLMPEKGLRAETMLSWTPEKLTRFINDQGKILPKRITGVTAKQQRAVTRAIKYARHLALLPFVTDDAR